MRWRSPARSVVFTFAASGAPPPGQTPKTIRAAVYSVKFLCLGDQFESLTANSGKYLTSISVHNPNAASVSFFKKIVRLVPQQAGHGGHEAPQPPGAFVKDTLEPNWGLDINCTDLIFLA
jgi:hypothetical protein